GKTARRHTMPLSENDRLVAPSEQSANDEVRAIVEEEVKALPDRLGGAGVLWYMEGRSNSEAATLLGGPPRTVPSPFAGARKKLHQRLLRRGVVLSWAVALETIWQSEGSAAVLSSLLHRTIQAVSHFVRTGSAAGAVASHVLTLVAGVANTMS